MSLAIYQEKFSQLAVNSAQGKVRPHKMCMLLAVLDLAQAGGLVENRIFFLPPLIERYLRFFDAVKGPNTQAHAYYPFFHLRGNLQNGEPSFWQLQPLPGREAAVEALDGVRSSRQLTDNIAYAKIDEELFEIIQSPDAIDTLGEAMTRHWFNQGLGELHAVMAISCEISRYEKRLRLGITTPSNELVLPDKKVRDPAFRRVVTQLYDYRCAATGIRLILVTGQALVEAAHILPFSESGDDDPRNGLPWLGLAPVDAPVRCNAARQPMTRRGPSAPCESPQTSSCARAALLRQDSQTRRICLSTAQSPKANRPAGRSAAGTAPRQARYRPRG